MDLRGLYEALSRGSLDLAELEFSSYADRVLFELLVGGRLGRFSFRYVENAGRHAEGLRWDSYIVAVPLGIQASEFSEHSWLLARRSFLRDFLLDLELDLLEDLGPRGGRLAIVIGVNDADGRLFVNTIRGPYEAYVTAPAPASTSVKLEDMPNVLRVHGDLYAIRDNTLIPGVARESETPAEGSLTRFYRVRLRTLSSRWEWDFALPEVDLRRVAETAAIEYFIEKLLELGVTAFSPSDRMASRWRDLFEGLRGLIVPVYGEASELAKALKSVEVEVGWSPTVSPVDLIYLDVSMQARVMEERLSKAVEEALSEYVRWGEYTWRVGRHRVRYRGYPATLTALLCPEDLGAGIPEGIGCLLAIGRAPCIATDRFTVEHPEHPTVTVELPKPQCLVFRTPPRTLIEIAIRNYEALRKLQENTREER